VDRPVKLQKAEELVDIAAWPLDEDFPVFPVGSKPKRAVLCPDPAPCAFLIAGHRYLFKVSIGWRIFQHWSEVISYQLSAIAGPKAAPCFVAIDSRTGEVGVLVEFFYGYPNGAVPPRFIAGADLMRRFITSFDADTDGHHTWQNVLRICKAFKVNDHAAWWSKLLAFDALIGNTDRHSENWGLLATKASGQWSFTMAPTFDHGTSLAYQVRNEHIARESDAGAILRHIARGNHHIRWASDPPSRGHFEVCRLIAEKHPSVAPELVQLASVSRAEVEAIVNQCCGFQLPQGGCEPARAEYLVKLIVARAAALKAAVEA
jgi:hypothetical protein